MKFGETPEQGAEVTAKLAVRHLVFYSSLPALAIGSAMRRTAGPARFPAQEVYERAAAAEGLFLQVAVHPVAGAFEHVLFLAKVRDLADAEIMSCRRPKTFNRHDPTGPRELV